MSTIKVQDLATLSPSALDGDYYGIVFTSDGDTNKVVFEDAVAQANSNNGCLCVQFASVEVTTAEILSFTTPVQLVPSVAATQYIEVISVVCKYDYGTATYSGGGNILIGSSSGPQFYFNGTLQATGDRYVKAIPSIPTGADSNIDLGDGIFAFTLANPTTGDGSMRFDITYIVKSE
jgi:hypothetical protein